MRDKCINLKDIYEGGVFGKPMTPGKWMSTGVQYIPVTRLCMSCGGGMGGSRWYEYIQRVPMEDLMHTQKVIVTTWDGKRKLINMNNVVVADEYTIASAIYFSDNPNFEIGEYRVARLIPDGKKIKLTNEFQSDV